MIGHGFMGAAHSQGWRSAPRFFDLPVKPVMQLIVGRAGIESSAERYGWAETATDWQEAVAREDIDIIDIVTPGDSHAEIAIAALEAGKHVLCEKPLANSPGEADAMATVAARAADRGVFAMVGFTFRRLPATTLARDMVAAGRVGTIHSVRASYLQDWLTDPDAPFTWRSQKEVAGTGALGDIGSHAIDLAQFVTGMRLESVSGTIETITKHRPIPGSPGKLGEVDVDDLALFTGRFESGSLAQFVASRFSTGRKNSLRLEVSGSKGAIAFDLEDLNFLEYFDARVTVEQQGFTRIMVTEPQHPFMDAWWPAGHMLGYEHGFSNQIRDFLEGIAESVQPTPSFADGAQVQRVLSAVESSSSNGSAWTRVAR